LASQASGPEPESEEAAECGSKAYYTAECKADSKRTVTRAKCEDDRKEVEPLPNAERDAEYVASALRPWAVGSETGDDCQQKACREPDGVKGDA
jgi:hypothetical protein